MEPQLDHRQVGADHDVADAHGHAVLEVTRDPAGVVVEAGALDAVGQPEADVGPDDVAQGEFPSPVRSNPRIATEVAAASCRYGADPTALVVGTSGSTGLPKGALLPVGALIASADATRCALTCTGGLHPHRTNGPAPPATPSGNWLLTLPAHHIAGIQVLLRSVAEGSTPVIMDTARPFTTEAFTAAVQRMPSADGSSRWCPPNCTGSWPIPRPRRRWAASRRCWSAARHPAIVDRRRPAGRRVGRHHLRDERDLRRLRV